MRLLVVLRGIPASGKSTFIKEHDLEGFVLCPDDYRVRIGGLTVDEKGLLRIPEKYNKKVWKQLYEDLELRMQEGITTVIDATHTRESYFNDYNKLCAKYRYRMLIVEFNTPLDECKQRNANRVEYKRYDDSVLDKMYAQMQNPLPAKYRQMVVAPEEFESTVNNIIYKHATLDEYKSIVIVGDIHGCYTALIEGLQQSGFIKTINEDGSFIFDDSIFVVFIGDYIDRGIENDKVVEFLYSIKDFKNVKLLEGNHESHLLKLSREGGWDNPYAVIGYAPETCKTVIVLTNEQKKKLSLVAQKCGYYFSFNYLNDRYKITHSAIPCTNMLALSANQIIRGIDSHNIYQNVNDIDYNCSQKIDHLLSIYNPDNSNVLCVHGHANPDPKNIVTHNQKHTYNLCDDVEYGGCLRIVKFNNDKTVETFNIKNTVFKEKETKNIENEAIIFELDNSKLIHKKELGDNVVSYNFSREAFYSQQWNKLTTTARGLFVDSSTGRVVARSYPKFFEIEQHGSTQWRNLEKNLKFPVTAYLKENGFLGIVSVRNGQLFVASKSTNQGEYKENFERILKTHVDCDKLKKYLEINNCSAIFECVDPYNDPHIIEYINEKVVLLDIVQNDFTDTFKSYDEVFSLAKEIGCKPKEMCKIFNTFEELKSFIEAFDKDDKNEIEGFVFVDQNNFMFKYKTPFYKFWKSMRKIKEMLVKDINQNIDVNKNIPEIFRNTAISVVKFMKNIPAQQLEALSIIDIRNVIENGQKLIIFE
jgi:predicted kinase